MYVLEILTMSNFNRGEYIHQLIGVKEALIV